MLGLIDIVAVVIDICVACSSRLRYHLPRNSGGVLMVSVVS